MVKSGQSTATYSFAGTGPELEHVRKLKCNSPQVYTFMASCSEAKVQMKVRGPNFRLQTNTGSCASRNRRVHSPFAIHQERLVSFYCPVGRHALQVHLACRKRKVYQSVLMLGRDGIP